MSLHRIKKTAAVTTAVVFVFVAALLSVALFLVESDYARGKVAVAFSGHLGREFSIDGPVDVTWHWKTPRVQAEKIRIANLAGSDAPYMMDIEKIDFRISIWKLLYGRLELPFVDITRPDFYLEKPDEKTNNWSFPDLSSAAVAREAVLPDERGDMPVIGKLQVREGVVTYKNAPRGIDATLNIDTVSGSQGKQGRIFIFKGEGRLDGQPFTLEATGGSLEYLRDTRRPFPLAFVLRAGKTVFSLDGTFKDPIRLTGLDTVLHLEGANLADLYYLLHVALPPTPKYKLDGQLAKEGDVWSFSDFSGSVGGSDLSGNVVYDAGGDKPLLKGDLLSKRMDVADLGGFIGYTPGTARPMAVRSQDRVIPDARLNLERLRSGDMDLTLKAARLVAPGWPLSGLDTRILLKDAVLKMDPLRFGLAQGKVDGSLVLDGSRQVPNVNIALDLHRLKLKGFFKGSRFDEFSEGAFDGQIYLKGSGISLARVLENSDGRIALVIPDGKISLALIEASDIDIAQLTPLLLGKDRTTDIRCGIADFTVVNGILKTNILVLDTEDTNLNGNARISLKDESLDAELNAKPKDPSILTLQAKILLSGKMKNPRVMIDPVSTAIRGASAAVLGALAPPAAFLPFIGLGGGKDSNCKKLIAQSYAN